MPLNYYKATIKLQHCGCREECVEVCVRQAQRRPRADHQRPSPTPFGAAGILDLGCTGLGCHPRFDRIQQAGIEQGQAALRGGAHHLLAQLLQRRLVDLPRAAVIPGARSRRIGDECIRQCLGIGFIKPGGIEVVVEGLGLARG